MAITYVSVGGNVVEVTGTGFVFPSLGTGPGKQTQPVALARIRWVSKTASQDDTCLVKDNAGNVIFESEATGADFSDEVELGKVPPFFGIQITTLASGNLFFYLR